MFVRVKSRRCRVSGAFGDAVPGSLLVLFFVLLLPPAVHAQQEPGEPVTMSSELETPAPERPRAETKDDEIVYRRWLAPWNQIPKWTLGDRYLPLTLKEWTELLEKASEERKTRNAPPLSRIELRATLKDLQLVDGRGVLECFDEEPETNDGNSGVEKIRLLPLEPWGLWTATTEGDNEESAAILRASDGSLRLRLPTPSADTEDEERRNRVRFDWSLRSRSEPGSGLSFDFELPPCLSTELYLDLPVSLAPSCNVGIVTKDSKEKEEGRNENNGERRRRWRILTGRHSRFNVTVSANEESRTSRRLSSVQRTMRYTIEPEGLNMSTTLKFEKADAKVDELIFDVESPLRIVSIHYGTQPVAWTRLGASEDGTGSRVHVGLSDFSDRRTDDLTIVALAPLPQSRPWVLPRLRVVSQNVFWKETRCGLHVLQPFLVRDLGIENAVQVRPRSAHDLSDREVFIFQFFEDDARLTVDFEEYSPEVATSGAVQFLWGNNEVRGNMVLECGIAEGDAYTLQFPISPSWTIDSVKSLGWMSETQKTLSEDEVLSWDVLEDREPGQVSPAARLLSIQLKHPIRPKKPLQIAISAHFRAGNQKEFRLHDFSPLQFPPGKESSHFIAIQQSSSQFHLQCRSSGPSRSNTVDAEQLRNVQRYIEDASGSVFALNARNREIRFVLERLKPNYSANISGIVSVREKELRLEFDVQCQPIDSTVDRIYVHFAPELSRKKPIESAAASLSEGADEVKQDETFWNWDWTGLTESVRPLQVRRLAIDELKELFPAAGLRGPFDDFPPGEIWEVRLSGPQSSPFGIRAAAAIPLPDMPTDSVEIPLASLPFSSSQRGEIHVKSSRLFPYRIVNTRLKSIPVAPAKWFRYEETRAAFRYNPREEPRLSLQSPLSLERLSPEEMPPSAWVWSLRLDTQYEPDGTVKNNAIFLLENQGKKTLRIRLPEGIDIEDVHAVWMDEQREIWHPEDETPEDRFYTPSRRNVASKTETSNRLVVVSLPEGTRFVTISLEYVGKSKPLVRRRKLEPRYPSVDVPILSGSWTAWFPPEFEVSLPAQPSPSRSAVRGPLRLSDAMSHLLSSRHFDPFSRTDWEWVFQHDQRRREAEFAARSFFDWISTKRQQAEEESDPENAFLKDNRLREGRPIRTGRSADLWREDGGLKWFDLFGNEKSLAELLSKLPQDGGKGIEVNILIDRKALALQGIFPHTAVAALESHPAKRHGDEIFEQAGLVLLVSSQVRPDKVRAYTFYVTSPLVLSLHRHFFTEPLGTAGRYVPETINLSRSPDAKETSSPPADPAMPQWIPLSRWLADSQPLSFPWSISSQINRLSSVTPHWNAFEMAQKPNNRLYVVHRKTFIAYQWLAFLTVVVLTMRKPFSHPVVLVFLLVLFEILTRLVAPCQAGVPSGAFLGALVSLGFCLIRPRALSTPRLKRRVHSSDTATHTRYEAEVTALNSSGNIRLPLLFPGPFIVTAILAAMTGGILHAETVLPRSNDSPSPAAPAASSKEAYRIFFPVDEHHRLAGNRVYAPVDLLDLLTRAAETVRPEPLRHWSIAKAEYRGSIDYNPVSQKLELGNDFSLVLDVVLESENAVISLPPLPLLQDQATWDSKPIQPTWRTQDADRRQHLVFHIENERKGRHRLRLALAPAKILREGVNRIEFDIPRVAEATLTMKTPPEAPPLTIAESFGAVTPNSAASPEFVARIGPVDKLSLSWPTEPDREEATSVEVEQRFDLLARPTQIEIWATFAFRINGGRIRHINLLIDPRWRLSGQYRCNEYAVETDEKPFHLPGPEGLPAARNQVVQMTFKEPVTGPLTLTAGFVLRDFSGVGKVRLPHFEALNTRIAQSTLAVSADPLLEVDCPETGLQSGYRPGWIGVAAPKTDVDGAIPALEETPIRDENLLAEYDLTRTGSDWVLGVRTRKSVPTLRLTQAVRFDQGDSTLLCQADFSSVGEIFQQHFSVPESFRIDKIEVRDSQDKLVEVRRSEVGRSPAGSSHCVFFKQPLSGRYSMTLRGGFETPSDFTEAAPPVPLRRRIPLPAFGDNGDNVRVEEQTLNLFRTASTMVDILAEGTGWAVSEVAPVLPESFREAFPCGCWKKSAGSTETTSTPEFSMLPNRPVIQGTQVTRLERLASDAWNTTFDFLWNIVDGELDTIRLRWDEQYSVLAVEPAMSFHLEQNEGRPILVLTPGSPLSGIRHFRIRSTLNHPGTSISVPHIGPEFDEHRQHEMKSYVVLPRYDSEERIPWSLVMLKEPDEETIRRLEEIISSPPADTASKAPAPFDESERPLFFQVIAEDFSATISRQNTLSVASLYDASFVVKDDGVVFGIATIDLRNRGQDSFILQMPDGYELIQITCSGIASKGTRLPPADGRTGDRWKVDLWSSDYPQRIRVIFRGSLVRSNGGSREPGVSLPVLKGVSVQKTIWLITFDAVRGKPFAPLDVSTVREKEFGRFSSPEILGEAVTDLGRHAPATGSESVQTLFKFNLLRLYHLRTILDLLSATSPSRSEEVRRWFSLWSAEWHSVNRLLDYLGRQYPESLLPGKHLFLLDLSGANLEESGFGAAELYLEANNITQPLQALTFGYKELVSKNFDLDEVEDEVRQSRNLSANSMLYWRDRLTEDAAYLFGASSGQIQEIRLKPVPDSHRFSERFLEWLFPWVLIPLLLPLFSRKLPFTEWFCQFPHFWGAVLGVLLWCLFPPGYFGIAVLALTYLSWMFPLWPKHTEFQEHPPS